MSEDLTESPSEKMRLKLANHSSRLEHGDRRMGELSLENKELRGEIKELRTELKKSQGSTSIDLKFWLSLVIAVCGFGAFFWGIIDRDVEQELATVRKDIASNDEGITSNAEDLVKGITANAAEIAKGDAINARDIEKEIGERKLLATKVDVDRKEATNKIEKVLEKREEWMRSVDRVIARAELQTEHVDAALAEFKKSRYDITAHGNYASGVDARFRDLTELIKTAINTN